MEEKLTYKQAINEIEVIVDKIENEELDVDELSGMVKRVSVLLKFCKDKLYKTEKEVNDILENMEEKE